MSGIKNIKLIIAILTALLCCQYSFLNADFSYAAVITDADIKEGLAFCAQYPVSLSYEGEKIEFSAKDVPPVIITPKGEKNGRTLIPVRALLEKMGATVTWYEETQTVGIELDDTSVLLTIGSDVAKVGNNQIVLDVPALIIDHDGDYYGSTMIPVRFVAESLGCEVGFEEASRTVTVKAPIKSVPAATAGGIFPDYEYAPLPKFTKAAAEKLIAIDAGHGGKDSGAVGHAKKADQLYEKKVNLACALKLRDYLEQAGGKTYMLRTTDSSIYIYDRPVMANEAEADFFVSVHNNSTENAKTNGTMVIYADKLYYGMNDEGRAITLENRAYEWAVSNPAITFDLNGKPVGTSELEDYGITSGEVAEKILKNMMEALGTANAGLKNNNSYIVINSTRMPAIIIEGAYLSNEEDFAKLSEIEEFANRYAYAAALGIIEAFNERWPD